MEVSDPRHFSCRNLPLLVLVGKIFWILDPLLSMFFTNQNSSGQYACLNVDLFNQPTLGQQERSPVVIYIGRSVFSALPINNNIHRVLSTLYLAEHRAA